MAPRAPRPPPRPRPRRDPTNPRASAVLAALFEAREVAGFPLAYRLGDLRRGATLRASTGLTTLVRAGGPPLVFSPAADDAAFAARLRAAAPFLAPELFRAGGGELVLSGAGAGALLASPLPLLAGLDLFRVGPPGTGLPPPLLERLRGALLLAWGGLEEADGGGFLAFSGPGAPPLRLHRAPFPSIPALLAAAGCGPAGVVFTGDRVFLSAAGRLAAELGLALALPGPGSGAALAEAFLAGFPLVFPGLPPPADPLLPGAFPGLAADGARRLEPHLFAAASAAAAPVAAAPVAAAPVASPAASPVAAAPWPAEKKPP